MQHPDRDPADLAAEQNLAASLGVMPAIPETDDEPADTRTPDEIRADAHAEAAAVDAQDQPAQSPQPEQETTALERLETMAQTSPKPRAIHITQTDWAELLHDQRAMSLIVVTSDGITFRGIAIGVEGGVDLPAPEMPEPAVMAEEEIQERRDQTGGPVQEAIDHGRDTGRH